MVFISPSTSVPFPTPTNTNDIKKSSSNLSFYLFIFVLLLLFLFLFPRQRKPVVKPTPEIRHAGSPPEIRHAGSPQKKLVQDDKLALLHWLFDENKRIIVSNHPKKPKGYYLITDKRNFPWKFYCISIKYSKKKKNVPIFLFCSDGTCFFFRELSLFDIGKIINYNFDNKLESGDHDIWSGGGGGGGGDNDGGGGGGGISSKPLQQQQQKTFLPSSTPKKRISVDVGGTMKVMI